jgi:DNA topoisomerase-2
LVLANGTKGIATGFATNILPRSVEDLSRLVREYLSDGNITNRAPVTFPDFKGRVDYDPEEDRHIVYGKYHKKTKTVMMITEVPYGFDRESYVKILDKLEDDGDIVSYEDLCDKTGFSFEVKLKQNTSANWNDAKIISKFKLSKPLSENITVIGPDGKLREYDDERLLIKDFVDYRLGVLQQRIEKRQAEAIEEARWLNVKMEFIQAVLDEKIVFKNRKKKDVADQILNVTSALPEDTDKLLRVNIMSLTDEMVKELQREIKSAQAELKFWTKTTPKKQFESDLEGIV